MILWYRIGARFAPARVVDRIVRETGRKPVLEGETLVWSGPRWRIAIYTWPQPMSWRKANKYDGSLYAIQDKRLVDLENRRLFAPRALYEDQIAEYYL